LAAASVVDDIREILHQKEFDTVVPTDEPLSNPNTVSKQPSNSIKRCFRNSV